MKFSVKDFAGDARLYQGLISALQAEKSRANNTEDRNMYDRMIQMLIGKSTTVMSIAWGKNPEDCDLRNEKLNEENQPSGQYVHQRIKVNEAVQGLEESVRMKIWIAQKDGKEQAQIIKDLQLTEEVEEAEKEMNLTIESPK